MTARTRSRRAAVAAAASLAVAALTGATTATAADAATTTSGTTRQVTVSGDPLVHDFSALRDGDGAEATWTVTNNGTTPVSIDGTLDLDTTGGPTLASALSFQFGDLASTTGTTWSAELPFDSPITASAALHHDKLVLAAGQSVDLPVRVILSDSSRVDWAYNPGQPKIVTADFVVWWTQTATETHGTTTTTRPGGLATTGALAPLTLLAAGGLLVFVGMAGVMARRDRDGRTDVTSL